MLHPIDSRAKRSSHKNGFVNDSRPLNAYACMPSNERLILEEAHLANDGKVVCGAASVGEAITR